jgi:hypothetical protein
MSCQVHNSVSLFRFFSVHLGFPLGRLGGNQNRFPTGFDIPGFFTGIF